MGMNLVAVPNFIYIQATEPSDKTAGRLWSDTDDGKLYAADGAAYNVVGAGAEKFFISDDVSIASDENKMSRESSYTKIKQLTLTMPLGPAAIRVKFSTRDSSSTGRIRIYKNGIAYGTEQTANNSTTVKTEDLVFDNEDTLEVWAWTAGAAIQCSFLRICGYGVMNAPITATIEDP